MRKLAFLLVCLFALPAAGQTWSGSGTPNDPYQICDACDMHAIGANSVYLDAHFKLMADIDLGAYTGTSFNIIGLPWDNPFTGVFDGNGHTISNFNYTSSGTDCIALFGYVEGLPGALAEIKDLVLIDANVVAQGRYGIGTLVGYMDHAAIADCQVVGAVVSGNASIVGGLVGMSNSGGVISNCSLSGSVTGDWTVGGLVGMHFGSITDCNATVSVTAIEEIGGLVGGTRAGTITGCSTSGSVVSNGYGNYGGYAGGLVGFQDPSNHDEPVGVISNCWSSCEVSYSAGDTLMVGGLVGINWEVVTDCYATGSVMGCKYVGGLLGANYGGGEVSNCHASGDVNAIEYVAGLVGDNEYNVSNCYSTGSVVGVAKVGGLLGYSFCEVVESCYSTSKTTGTTYVGGFVGYNQGYRYYEGAVTSNCYATGSVSGENYVGGFAGYDEDGKVSYCYSAGVVDGNNHVGGFLGGTDDTEVLSLFWDVNTSGHTTSADGEGKTTVEMQDANTFISAGWDFNTPIWKFCSVPDYPRLYWEECLILEPAELIAELLEEVGELELPGGIENSLMAKLNAALRALEDENENNDGAAINALQAFIKAVEAQRGKKIAESEADALIAAAMEIIDLLSNE